MLLQKPGFCGSDDEFGCAVWLARVSNHGVVEIYTASRHMWGHRFEVPDGWVVPDAGRV